MSEKTGFDALMDVVCVKWGFCGGIVDGEHRHVCDYIPEEGTVSADQFIRWVFYADGTDFDDSRWDRHKAAFKNAFIELMGAEVVDARLLRWDLD